MTLVRRHLVVAVTLVLALATGIALGAGPLSRERLVQATTKAEQPPPAVDSGPSSDDLAEVAGGTLRGTRLDGRGVALLSAPGVEPDLVDALAADIEDADGAVVARWSAGRSLVDAGEKTLVDTLGSQLLEQLGSRAAGANASAYRRMGQLVGTAIASRRGDGATPSRDALTIRQSIDAASLLSSPAEEARLAPLVLVVLADDLDDNVVEDLVAGLASRASGVVVAAPQRDGDLSVLEEVGEVTTVDGLTGVDGTTGRLAAVLALAGAESDPGGSYGASGSDGLLPLR